LCKDKLFHRDNFGIVLEISGQPPSPGHALFQLRIKLSIFNSSDVKSFPNNKNQGAIAGKQLALPPEKST
jgi:hypothetical protein